MNRKMFLFKLTIVLTIVVPAQAQNFTKEPLPTFRVIVSDSKDIVIANTIVYLNAALRGYISEVARDVVSINILKDEFNTIKYLDDMGLIDRTGKPSSKGWREADFAVVIAKHKKKYEAAVIPLAHGNYYRVVLADSRQPRLIARDIALLLAALVK